MKGSYTPLIILGSEIVGLVIGSWILGQALDQHFGTPGYWLTGLMIASFLAWVFHVLILLDRLDKNKEKNNE